MCGAYWCAGAPPALSCIQQRVDVYGQPLCELCGRRLRTVKHHRAHGPGRACTPRCKLMKHAVDDAARPAAAAVSAVPRPSCKRRAESDPGEPLNLARLRTRAAPPPPPATTIPPTKKGRVQTTPVDAALLLDQAHARRLALLAAEENRTAHGPSNGSAVVWQP